MFSMPGRSYLGDLQPLTKEETEIKNQLMTHIDYLALKIGERNIWNYKKLDAAAVYIEETFKNFGYKVFHQVFKTNNVLVKNIIAEIPGTMNPEEIVVIGAHYDSVKGSPGADDNASGVAAILEFARLFKNLKFKRTIRLVAFVNEEPPFFFTKKMGSYQYAHKAKIREEKIVAMLSIESIGYYKDQKNSQKYPFPLNFFYPTTANFIGFVSNLSSNKLLRNSISIFRKYAKFPSEGISLPWWFIGVGWSDQISFWKHGYSAIMVTGTALFRNPNYHRSTDTSETLDYSSAARVVMGLTYVIKELAQQKN